MRSRSLLFASSIEAETSGISAARSEKQVVDGGIIEHDQLAAGTAYGPEEFCEGLLHTVCGCGQDNGLTEPALTGLLGNIQIVVMDRVSGPSGQSASGFFPHCTAQARIDHRAVCS